MQVLGFMLRLTGESTAGFSPLLRLVSSGGTISCTFCRYQFKYPLYWLLLLHLFSGNTASASFVPDYIVIQYKPANFWPTPCPNIKSCC